MVQGFCRIMGQLQCGSDRIAAWRNEMTARGVQQPRLGAASPPCRAGGCLAGAFIFFWLFLRLL